MEQGWVCIEIGCPSDEADELAAEAAMTFGVGVEVLAGGVRLYLKEEVFFGEGKQKLEAMLTDLQPATVEERHPKYSISTLEEEDWLEGWKLHFKPLRVGRHLIVAPTWEEVHPGPGDRVIRLDPGRAFGTGHHETTRLCLEWLEEWAKGQQASQPRSLLDVGTGSGILAITAALLGFHPITAVDNDPEAIEVAKENIRLNGVADSITLRPGSVGELHSRFDVVMANIQASPLVEMADLLASCLNDSARLVLSGILLDQGEQVQVAYEAKGLKLHCRAIAGEWCLLVFESLKEGLKGCSKWQREGGSPLEKTSD
jgi:ribosomal protein L11 methyltransferase